jgi:large subunit ribosomal protein L21
MYAIIDAMGKQLKVRENEKVLIPKQEANEGDEIVISRVLLVSDGETVKVGTPTVEGARVIAEVVGHKKLPKVTVFKFKRRKNYRRKKGHRQPVTEVLIKNIMIE